MSSFDEPFAPWGEITTFGNPWHGYLQGGNLFRQDGVAMTLPSGIQHYSAPDGSSRLIDIGADAIVTSTSEQAMGMGWWNKALLSGSGFNASVRIYNDVHGSGGAIQFRKSSWVYKCADGTVYVLWISGENKIRADKLIMPTSTVPSNDTGGSIVLDISSTVVTSRTVGGTTYPLYSWLNFAPDGVKAALHFGYIADSGYTQYTYQIFEFAVSGGDDTTAPTVTLAQYRSLNTSGLVTVFTQAITYVEQQGPNDVLPVWQPTGTEISRTTTVVFVDYAENSDTKEVSIKNEQVYEFTPYIDSRGHSNVSVEGDSSLRILVNGTSVMAAWHLMTLDADNSISDTITTNDPYPALGNIRVLNGNLAVVATDSGISFATTGVASGTPTFYGIVGANAVIGDAKSAIATGLSVSDLAVDPITGAFTSGRTRYF